MKSVITVLTLTTLCISGLFIPSVSAADWSGHISKNTIVGRPYGQLVSLNKLGEAAELKVVCFQEDSFWLYLDDKFTNNNPLIDIVVSVDKLPSIDLTLKRKGENYTITNEAPVFWDLIAQMAAGTVLWVDIGGANQKHKYSLEGFTRAFLDTCDWIDSVDNYQDYLGRYR